MGSQAGDVFYGVETGYDTFIGAGGAETLLGQGGNNLFILKAGQLAISDINGGGEGQNTLGISGGGTVTNASFANVGNMSVLQLFDGDDPSALSITSNLQETSGEFLTIDLTGRTGVTTVDLASDQLEFTVIAGTGLETLTGSSSNAYDAIGLNNVSGDQSVTVDMFDGSLTGGGYDAAISRFHPLHGLRRHRRHLHLACRHAWRDRRSQPGHKHERGARLSQP